MNRVIIVVEGQTEEEFVKSVIVPYMAHRSIFITPIVVRTSQNFKGGIVSYQKFKNDVVRYLKQNQEVTVTSMIDFFRIPTDFPFYADLGQILNVLDQVAHLEKGISKDINEDRFIPYIQLHEFEALLFSSRVGFEGIADVSSRRNIDILREIDAIMTEYESPEMINSRPEFAPSKRIMKIFPEYNKVIYGSLIAQEIGIETIRSKCTRFDAWIQSIIDRFV